MDCSRVDMHYNRNTTLSYISYYSSLNVPALYLSTFQFLSRLAKYVCTYLYLHSKVYSCAYFT